MTPSFRSSGIVVQEVEQAAGRHEIIVAQVNVVPVSSADAGNMKVVLEMAMGTLNDYDRTMDIAEIIEALRYAADQLEAQQR
jgi:dihydroxyacetone kinase-like predicted kinase